MKIRKATMADVPALVALNQSVQELHAAAFPERFRRNVSAEVMERAFVESFQAEHSLWLIAEIDQPIAFLNAEFRDRAETWCQLAQRVCYLAGIAVAPLLRRKGVARALLAELQRDATVRGVTTIELDVWSFNEQARQAFARLGFRGVMERMSFKAPSA